MLKFFKVVAILEGISYLALFSNMLSNPIILIFIKAYCLSGWAGVLFIGYVIVATLLKKSQNWNFKNLRLSISLSYPLWYFYVEKILRECLNSLKNIWLFLSNTAKMGYWIQHCVLFKSVF
jgi:integral membrane protein